VAGSVMLQAQPRSSPGASAGWFVRGSDVAGRRRARPGLDVNPGRNVSGVRIRPVQPQCYAERRGDRRSRQRRQGLDRAHLRRGPRQVDQQLRATVPGGETRPERALLPRVGRPGQYLVIALEYLDGSSLGDRSCSSAIAADRAGCRSARASRRCRTCASWSNNDGSRLRAQASDLPKPEARSLKPS